MQCICKLFDLGLDVPKDPNNYEFQCQARTALKYLFKQESYQEFWWNVEKFIFDPETIKTTAKNWNAQVKNEFLELVKDYTHLESMPMDTVETFKIVNAAHCLDNDDNFFCDFHVFVPQNTRGRPALMTLIREDMLNDILAHPEEYLLTIGVTETKI